ncbi:hypothetical protein EVAR_10390_1 [Eumeta japonica]|uniref:Uncharacterized protein n=1 Tax=Eumeta variegata TaxID=151549 RepID=A0A4C1UDY8_EUMVA|nr:hypothetical protein EVAR_10390_1 [Eumeta japonica]
MDIALNERTLTVEMVKSVGSCDQLDEVVETYTECIRHACDVAIPRKSSKARGLKSPWREYVVGEYVQAREAYERVAAKAQTTS